MTDADAEIQETAERLAEMKARLGERYWADSEARALQDELRRRLGAYGAWSPDGAPPHRRARQAAEYESRFARLLWPGGDEG